MIQLLSVNRSKRIECEQCDETADKKDIYGAWLCEDCFETNQIEGAYDKQD